MIGILAFFNSTLGRYLLIGLLVAASYGAAYMKGRSHGWDKREAQAVEEYKGQLKALELLSAKRGEITEKVVVQYRDRIKVVKEKGDAIITQVEKLIPIDTCDVPVHFRGLHDAAATGEEFPRAAAGVDAAPPTIREIAETVARNYAAARANAEQLKALQEWVEKQSQLSTED